MATDFHSLAVKKWAARPEFLSVPQEIREEIADRCHRGFMRSTNMRFFERWVGISAILATIVGEVVAYWKFGTWGWFGGVVAPAILIFADVAALAWFHAILSRMWLHRFLESPEVKALLAAVK